jgi:membrane associated rhomboid family serine protease
VVEHAEEAYSDSEWYNFIENFGDNPNSSSYINESKRRVNYLYEREANIPLVGASGAIFGILMAFALLFPNTEIFLLFFPFPIKAKYFVLFYGLYEVYALVERAPGDNVAHLAHLGGMLFAFVLVKVWQKDRNNFY